MATDSPQRKPWTWQSIALTVIAVVMIGLGVFQVYAYVQGEDTQDCLVDVANQGGQTRQAALTWTGDLLRLVKAQPTETEEQRQARADFLASITRYRDELRAAEVKSECLDQVQP